MTTAATHRVAYHERALIAAALREPGIVPAMDCEPRDFLQPQASVLWSRMTELVRAEGWRNNAHLARLVARDEHDVAAYDAYLRECLDTLASPRDAATFALEVQRASVTRQALRMGERAAELEADGLEGTELVAALATEVATLQRRIRRKRGRSAEELARDGIDAMLAGADDPLGSTYVPIGLEQLDVATGGWQGGVVSIVGGKTSHGKSALLLQCALHAAQAGHGVHMLAAEDLEGDTMRRLVARLSGLSPTDLLRYRAWTPEQRERVERARERVAELRGLHLDQISGLDANQIVALVRCQQEQLSTRLVIVDYIQRLPVPRGSKRYDVLAEAMDVFDRAAKQDGFAWVIGSQLKRTEGDIPALGDFRGAGEIEEVCKMALGIYRPRKGTERDDEMRIDVLKASNAEPTYAVFGWHGPTLQITEQSIAPWGMA